MLTMCLLILSDTIIKNDIKYRFRALPRTPYFKERTNKLDFYDSKEYIKNVKHTGYRRYRNISRNKINYRRENYLTNN